MFEYYKEKIKKELAKKKSLTPEKLLADKTARLETEFRHWDSVSKYGCRDPFWPDGTNMNLTRNHIIAFKEEIRAINSLYRTGLPDIYYRETPQEVPNQYMATLEPEDEHQKKRVEQSRKLHGPLTTKALPETNPQLTFL